MQIRTSNNKLIPVFVFNFPVILALDAIMHVVRASSWVLPRSHMELPAFLDHYGFLANVSFLEHNGKHEVHVA